MTWTDNLAIGSGITGISLFILAWIVAHVLGKPGTEISVFGIRYTKLDQPGQQGKEAHSETTYSPGWPMILVGAASAYFFLALVRFVASANEEIGPLAYLISAGPAINAILAIYFTAVGIANKIRAWRSRGNRDALEQPRAPDP